MPRLNSRSGQGLVEYILIIALMGILSIAAINALSNTTQDGFTESTNKLNREFQKVKKS